MADILVSIVESVVATLTQQVGYVLFYRSHLNDLRDARERLQVSRERVQIEIDTATRNGEIIIQEAYRWLYEADHILLEASHVFNADSHTGRCCVGVLPVPNPATRVKLGRKAINLMREIQSLSAESHRIISHPQPDSIVRESEASSAPSDYVYLSQLTIKSIVEALCCRGTNVVGACGATSTAASILVREVSNHVHKEMLFEKVMEITPSTLFRFDDNFENALVILHCLSETLDLDDLGIPFNKNAKVLLLSESREILTDMGAQSIFNLESLTEKEAWLLFKKAVGDSAEYPHIKPLAIEIVKECRDSPVLLDAVVKKLKLCGLNGWEDTLNELKCAKKLLQK